MHFQKLELLPYVPAASFSSLRVAPVLSLNNRAPGRGQKWSLDVLLFVIIARLFRVITLMGERLNSEERGIYHGLEFSIMK